MWHWFITLSKCHAYTIIFLLCEHCGTLRTPSSWMLLLLRHWKREFWHCGNCLLQKLAVLALIRWENAVKYYTIFSPFPYVAPGEFWGHHSLLLHVTLFLVFYTVNIHLDLLTYFQFLVLFIPSWISVFPYGIIFLCLKNSLMAVNFLFLCVWIYFVSYLLLS